MPINPMGRVLSRADPRPRDAEHFRRAIQQRHARGHREHHRRPQACAASHFQRVFNAALRSKPAFDRPNQIRYVNIGVVLSGARTVIGELLVNQFHGRTPRRLRAARAMSTLSRIAGSPRRQASATAV